MVARHRTLAGLPLDDRCQAEDLVEGQAAGRELVVIPAVELAACGNGAHLISGIMHASWSVVPDFPYCNYAMYFGASKGHAAGHASCSNMGLAADARRRTPRVGTS